MPLIIGKTVSISGGSSLKFPFNGITEEDTISYLTEEDSINILISED